MKNSCSLSHDNFQQSARLICTSKVGTTRHVGCQLPEVAGGCHVGVIIYLFIYCPFRAASMAYGGSQARGLIRAAAAGLQQSHSNARSQPHLPPKPQLTAMPDPQATEQGQGSNLHPHGF